MRTYPQRRSLRSALLLPVVGALLLAGCSGGGDAEPSAVPSTSTEATAESTQSEAPTEEAVQDPLSDAEQVATGIASEEQFRSQSGMFGDYSHVEIPADVISTFGEEVSARVLSESNALLWEVKNGHPEFFQERSGDDDAAQVAHLESMFTPEIWQHFTESALEDGGNGSGWRLVEYGFTDGTVALEDDAPAEARVPLDPETRGQFSSLREDPVVELNEMEDGSPCVAVIYQIHREYFPVEGSLWVDHKQTNWMVPGENGSWVLGWWERSDAEVHYNKD